MKKLSVFLFLFCGLTSASSVQAQPIAQLFYQGYDAVAENYYAYLTGQNASNFTLNNFEASSVSNGLTNLFYAYDCWIYYGDAFYAAQFSFYAYRDFFNSGMVDRGAFNNAYNNGFYLNGNIGFSDPNAWDAAWLSLYAAYDYYYRYIF